MHEEGRSGFMHEDRSKRPNVSRGRAGKVLVAATLGVLGVLGVVGVGVAATTSSDAASASQASPNIVAQAKSLIAFGQVGLLTTTVNDTQITSNSQIVRVKGWPGPTSTPKPPSGQSVQIVVCLFGTACETLGRGAAAAARVLGWKTQVLDGKGTAQGAASALDTALSKNPDVIMTAGIPETEIADKLKRAHQQGVKLVGISSAYEAGAKAHYDAYVSLHEIVNTILQINYAIADSNGHANAVYLWDPGYPVLTSALNISRKIFNQCKGCKILEVYNRPITTAADPVAMGKIANSLAQKYGKKLQYIFTPYGFGVAPVIAALRAAGRSDVKVLSGNGEPQNLGMVNKGWQAADFGTSAEWAGYAAVDQSIRLLAGARPLPDYKEGVSVHVFTQKNAPKSGVVNWRKYVNFAAQYKKLWGVK
jgi:ribose transport system substrate-binding protein